MLRSPFVPRFKAWAPGSLVYQIEPGPGDAARRLADRGCPEAENQARLADNVKEIVAGRAIVLLARPPVVVLLALFTAVGQMHEAGEERPWQLAQALLLGMAYLIFSVAVNDISDVAVDRVNLPGDRRRGRWPLVSARPVTWVSSPLRPAPWRSSLRRCC